MARLLVTAGCPEVLGVTPLKKARRTRGLPGHTENRRGSKESGLPEDFRLWDDDPRALFEIEEARRDARQSMRFSTELFFFVRSVSPEARASRGIKTPASI